MIDIKALVDFTCGMYIITTEYENKYSGCIVDAVIQQGMEPAILTVSMHKHGYTREVIERSRKFTLSVIARDTNPQIISNFGFGSSKDKDKFASVDYKIVGDNMPAILDGTCSYIECKVIDVKEVGDHIIFFASIESAEKLTDKEPMTYKYYYDTVRLELLHKKDEVSNMENLEFYVCTRCGNLVELIQKGIGNIVCCKEEMTRIESNSTDAAHEKHVPELKIDGNILTVNIGSIDHPMVDEHYIQFIYVVDKERVQRISLTSSDKPRAKFIINNNSDIDVYAYCNIHGLWKASLKK